MTIVIIRREEDTEKHREGLAKMEVEIEVLHAQAKGHRGSPAATQRWEQGAAKLPVRASWRNHLVNILISDFWLPKLSDSTVLLF